MLTQTTAPPDHWRRSDDHDALQALIAESLTTDSCGPGNGDW
jgi:hypothetical protein